MDKNRQRKRIFFVVFIPSSWRITKERDVSVEKTRPASGVDDVDASTHVQTMRANVRKTIAGKRAAPIVWVVLLRAELVDTMMTRNK